MVDKRQARRLEREARAEQQVTGDASIFLPHSAVSVCLSDSKLGLAQEEGSRQTVDLPSECSFVRGALPSHLPLLHHQEAGEEQSHQKQSSRASNYAKPRHRQVRKGHHRG